MSRILRYSSSTPDETSSLRSVLDTRTDVPAVAIEVDYDADRADVLVILAKLAAAVIEDTDLQAYR